MRDNHFKDSWYSSRSWLYQSFLGAKQNMVELARKLRIGAPKKPFLDNGAPDLWLFDRQFAYSEEIESLDLDEIEDERNGKNLGQISPYTAFLSDFHALIWMSYRTGFEEIGAPYSFSSDTGWGCMLRSAQMLLAEALVRHMGVAEWRRRYPASQSHRALIAWFLDTSCSFASFSIHRMTECGKRYDKYPGEWYGPSTAALVLRDLVNVHSINGARLELTRNNIDRPSCRKQRQNVSGRGKCRFKPDLFGQDLIVLVTDDSATLYTSEVDELVLNGFNTERESKEIDSANKHKSCGKLGSDVGETGVECTPSEINDPLLNPKAGPTWISAILIIVPLRLGLNEINEEYAQPLIETLKFPQCVGIIGGKPSHSLYFVGSQGRDFVYLDPHTVQTTELVEGDTSLPSQDVVNSYHCSSPQLVNALSIDPSLAIGFYCSTESEFADLLARIGQLDQYGKPFLTVRRTRPSYDLDSDLEFDSTTEEDSSVRS